MSHKRAVSSALPDAATPDGATRTLYTWPSCEPIRRSWVPRFVSQSLTVPSQPPVTSDFESGVKAAERTGPRWPSPKANSLLDSASQMRTQASSPAAAIRRPSEDQSTDQIRPWGLPSLAISVPRAVSIRLTSPLRLSPCGPLESAPPAIKLSPFGANARDWSTREFAKVLAHSCVPLSEVNIDSVLSLPTASLFPSGDGARHVQVTLGIRRDS